MTVPDEEEVIHVIQVIKENILPKYEYMLSYLMGSMRSNKDTFGANPACHKMLIWT